MSEQGDKDPVRFIIEGAPRTKKNHGKTITRWDKAKQKNRQYHVGSDALKLWTDKAVIQMKMEWAVTYKPITEPVNVKALVYREALTGDLVGFLQAIADALQEARVLDDDKWIHGWDGSRPLKDRARPRVELEITALT